MSHYTIRLVNCAFFARHGVHDEEEVLGQRFFVDAEIDVHLNDALESDSISSTVDYGAAFTEIERIVTGKRRHLIEALANDIAHALSSRFPQIRRIVITIRKPNAPVQGVLDHVSVTVVHVA